VPQQVQVIDAAGPAGHPGDQARDLRLRVHAAPMTDPHVPAGHLAQPCTLRQGHHRHQARPGHQIRVIK
jgi:hypothetical protein